MFKGNYSNQWVIIHSSRFHGGDDSKHFSLAKIDCNLRSIKTLTHLLPIVSETAKDEPMTDSPRKTIVRWNDGNATKKRTVWQLLSSSDLTYWTESIVFSLAFVDLKISNLCLKHCNIHCCNGFLVILSCCSPGSERSYMLLSTTALIRCYHNTNFNTSWEEIIQSNNENVVAISYIVNEVGMETGRDILLTLYFQFPSHIDNIIKPKHTYIINWKTVAIFEKSATVFQQGRTFQPLHHFLFLLSTKFITISK